MSHQIYELHKNKRDNNARFKRLNSINNGVNEELFGSDVSRRTAKVFASDGSPVVSSSTVAFQEEGKFGDSIKFFNMFLTRNVITY